MNRDAVQRVRETRIKIKLPVRKMEIPVVVRLARLWRRHWGVGR